MMLGLDENVIETFLLFSWCWGLKEKRREK